MNAITIGWRAEKQAAGYWIISPRGKYRALAPTLEQAEHELAEFARATPTHYGRHGPFYLPLERRA